MVSRGALRPVYPLGVYAVPPVSGRQADRAEWIMFQGKIPVADYRPSPNTSPPRNTIAGVGATRRDAGIKYVVITAKHHDGFALFDSAFSDWNAVKASGARRDLIAHWLRRSRQGATVRRLLLAIAGLEQPGGGKGRGRLGMTRRRATSTNTWPKSRCPRCANSWRRSIPTFCGGYRYQMTPERARPFFDLVTSHPKLIHNSRLGAGVLGDFRTSEQRIPASGMQGGRSRST